MKLRTIHIESFGLLRNKTLQLEGSLTLLYGRNEAGKSTLMGFIRAVLFGFPSRAGGDGAHEPQLGAGYLTLETAEGELIRIERRESAPAGTGRSRAPGGGRVIVTLASGAQGGARQLQQLLGGITGELFRSLFAFSLSELQEVRTLQSDALSGYLYSAGLGARGDTIMAAERKLSLELEQLFRPRGRNQPLNQSLLKLEEQEQGIRRSKEQAGRYNDYIAELARLDEQLLTAAASVKELRSAVAWLEAAEQARNHWLRSKEIQQLLASLPEFKHFPEDALSRFNELTKNKEQYLNEHNKLQSGLEKLQSELEPLSLEPQVLEHSTELEALYIQLPVYQVNQQVEQELNLEVEHQTVQLERMLRQISITWNEALLSEYAVTVLDREQIRNWDIELDKWQQLHSTSEAELTRASLHAEEAKEKANRLETRLIAKQRQVYDELTLEAQHEMDHLFTVVPYLRKQLQQKHQLKLELKHLEHRELDYTRMNESGQAADKESSTASTGLKVLRGLLLIILLGLPLYFIIHNQVISALLSFLILLVLAMGAWKYPLLFPKSNRTKRVFPLDKLSTERMELEQRLQELEVNFSQRLQQLHAIKAVAVTTQNSIVKTASTSQASIPIHTLSINDQQAEESLDLLQQAAETWRESKRELSQDELKWQEAAEESEKHGKLKKFAAAKLDEHGRKLAEAEAAWGQWLILHKLASGLSPAGVLEIFQIVEASQQQLQHKSRNQAKRQTVQQYNAKFVQQIKALLNLNDSEDVLSALKKWKESADLMVIALQSKQLLEQQQLQTRSELMLIVEALERNSLRINELWEAAEASNEAQFRLHLRQFNEQVAYSEELRQLESALDVFIGSNRKEKLDKLLEELAPLEMKQKIEDDNTALKIVESLTDELKENRGKLRSELEKLEQGLEHSERLQLLQEQSAVLVGQAGQWAVTAFCAALFRKARELYERERQPGVLLLAAKYLHSITAGEYVRILVPIGEKRIVVEHASGRIMDSSLLSRGTAEQLYLSMRFAIAEEYARKASLPLVLDDILVNFDKARMEQTIGLLAEISNKHQIIFFTCHPHVAEAFKNKINIPQRIDL